FYLPFNPQALAAPAEHLSFNTAVSFATNTNWQSYGGETTLSYLTQMLGLTVQNFASAAGGMALAIVLIRPIGRHETAKLGNFWADTVRGTLYILVPMSVVLAIVLMSQGVVQNFRAYDTAALRDPYVAQVDKKDDAGNVVTDADGNNVKEDQNVDSQTIAQGP